MTKREKARIAKDVLGTLKPGMVECQKIDDRWMEGEISEEEAKAQLKEAYKEKILRPMTREIVSSIVRHAIKTAMKSKEFKAAMKETKSVK
jgi:hypothetical protein